MSEGDVIVCRPTKWFLWRAGAMVVMFGVFCGLFLKDWKIGWPRLNEVYYSYKAFEKAKEAFKAEDGANSSAEAWEGFASKQEIGFPDGPGMLPSGVDPKQKWPSVLVDYEAYRKAVETEGNKAIPPMWADYSDERGWGSSPPEKSYDQKKIAGQLYWAIGSGILTLVALFFLVRTSRRSMKVDAESFMPPGGAPIPFDQIKRIDKRKWETKGLAYLYCGAGERVRKVKVDGMVYGQFKAEDGAPAEKLFARILKNFSGDLIELEDDEDLESDGLEAGSEEEAGGPAGGEDGEGSRD